MENATESLHRRAPPCLELRQPDSTGTRRYFILRASDLFWTRVTLPTHVSSATSQLSTRSTQTFRRRTVSSLLRPGEYSPEPSQIQLAPTTYRSVYSLRWRQLAYEWANGTFVMRYGFGSFLGALIQNNVSFSSLTFSRSKGAQVWRTEHASILGKQLLNSARLKLYSSSLFHVRPESFLRVNTQTASVNGCSSLPNVIEQRANSTLHRTRTRNSPSRKVYTSSRAGPRR
jgi:hypothetical protein